MQTDDGLLLHGSLGEKLVNHYTFYAAFATEEEYRLVTQGRTLGSLPVSQPLLEGSYIIFAGRRWRVLAVDEQHKLITVAPAPAGRPPIFGGGAGLVHDRVRQEMLAVYQETERPAFLDRTAQDLLSQGREACARYGLGEQRVVQVGNNVQIFPWRGDVVHNSLALLLKRKKNLVENEGLAVVVFGAEKARIIEILAELAEDESFTDIELAASVKTKLREKWDWALSESLLCADYAASVLDTAGARTACRELL